MKIGRRVFSMPVLAVGVVFLAQAAGADMVTLGEAQHSYLNEGVPGTPYGGGATLQVGTADGINEMKTILKFDTTDLEGINFEVTGITLYLRLSGNAGTHVKTHSVYAINQTVTGTKALLHGTIKTAPMTLTGRVQRVWARPAPIMTPRYWVASR